MEKRLGKISSSGSAQSKFIDLLQISYTSTSAAVDSQCFQVSFFTVEAVHTTL